MNAQGLIFDNSVMPEPRKRKSIKTVYKFPLYGVRLVREAGKILGIPVHDHIIVAAGSGYTSFCERGLI